MNQSGNGDDDDDEEEEKDDGFVSIKSSLNSQKTDVASLASLLLLYKVKKRNANFYGRFARNTRPNRLKVFRNCVPYPNAYLQTSVLTKKSKRRLHAAARTTVHTVHAIE